MSSKLTKLVSGNSGHSMVVLLQEFLDEHGDDEVSCE